MSSFKSIPELILNTYYQYQDSCSFASVGESISQKLSITTFFHECCRLSKQLKSVGVKNGDCVALMGPGSSDWLCSDLAIQLCGAITIPIFPQLSHEIFEYEIKHSEAKVIICLDQQSLNTVENFDTLFEHIITKEISDILKNSISFTESLVEKPTEDNLIDYAKSCIQEIKPDDTLTIIYTSGSTGYPKGVELTHRNILTQVAAAAQRFHLEAKHDVVLSCLPMAHIFEKMVMYFYLSRGLPIHFVEDINQVAGAMQQVKPTIITLVPRLLEKVKAKMEEKIMTSSGIKHKLGTWALNMAKNNDFTINKPLLHPIADAIIFKKFRAAFGGKIEKAISGGAALNKDVNLFFNNIGVPVYQGYGLTETSPVICANYPGNNKLGTVGKLFPDIEVKIDPENQEICTRGPHLMRSYYKNSEATNDTIKDGWLHTGDCGSIDNEGYLSITGRIKEMFKTSNGKYVCPVPIEQKLSECNIVDMSMVIADGRSFCSALIFIDRLSLENTHQIKLDQDIPKTLMDDFKIKVQKHIDQLNPNLNHWENIYRFQIIPDRISIESGELTPTMKIKRHFIQKKYEALIDQLYADPQHNAEKS